MTSFEVKVFFDNGVSKSSTCQYVVYDTATRHCAIIDPVWDFDLSSGRFTSTCVDEIDAFVKEQKLEVKYLLSTHVHADHVAGDQLFKQRYPSAKTAIGENVKMVQEVFKGIYNADYLKTDGSQFDVLLKEGDQFSLGDTPVRVLHTPGHTPACITYVVGANDEAVFVGDTLFMPDSGTARCDFPRGSAKQLYESLQKILALPPTSLVYVCHDYQPNNREFVYVCTVAEHKEKNKHVKDGVSEQEFVEMRETRDAQLNFPRLLIPSIQVNANGGQLPPADDNGTVYLKTPVNRL